MKPPRGKTIAVAAAVLGLMIVAVAGFLCRGYVLDRWEHWRLEASCISELGSAIRPTRLGAAQWLAEHGSARAVPVLLERAAEDAFCLDAVKEIGRPALPALQFEFRRKLQSGRGGLSADSLAETLIAIGGPTQETARCFLEWLTPPGESAYVAARAVARIGPLAREAVPALIPLLTKTGGRFAAQALGAIGPDAKEAAPALFDLAKGTTPHSPYRRALVGIGEGAAPFLAAQLRVKAARSTAARILEEIGPAAVPALAGVLGDTDLEVRLTAAEILAVIHVESEAAVAVLIAALESGQPETGDRAATALVKFGWQAVQLLAGEIRAGRGAARAARILGQIGPPAKPAAPELRGLLSSPDPGLKETARAALANIGDD